MMSKGATTVTHAEQLADFVSRASFNDLSDGARAQLKIRVLDSLGCAIAAIGSFLVKLPRKQLEEFDGTEIRRLIGGGRAAPDRAASYNSALVRYLVSTTATYAKVSRVIRAIAWRRSWQRRSSQTVRAPT